MWGGWQLTTLRVICRLDSTVIILMNGIVLIIWFNTALFWLQKAPKHMNRSNISAQTAGQNVWNKVSSSLYLYLNYLITIIFNYFGIDVGTDIYKVCFNLGNLTVSYHFRNSIYPRWHCSTTLAGRRAFTGSFEWVSTNCTKLIEYKVQENSTKIY